MVLCLWLFQGTIPYMAIEILAEYAKQEGTIVHQAKHDLESFVYVLIWICVLYGDPRNGNSARDVSLTCLSTWTSPKSLKEIRGLAVFKRGDLHDRVALEEFDDYFEDLKDTVKALYDAIGASNFGGAPLSHATVKRILLDAFFTVTEPTLQSTERFEAGTKRKKNRGNVVLQTTKQRRLH
jgi:Fungal protein kinase